MIELDDMKSNLNISSDEFLLYFDQLFDQEKLNECPTYLILDSI